MANQNVHRSKLFILHICANRTVPLKKKKAIFVEYRQEVLQSYAKRMMGGLIKTRKPQWLLKVQLQYRNTKQFNLDQHCETSYMTKTKGNMELTWRPVFKLARYRLEGYGQHYNSASIVVYYSKIAHQLKSCMKEPNALNYYYLRNYKMENKIENCQPDYKQKIFGRNSLFFKKRKKFPYATIKLHKPYFTSTAYQFLILPRQMV